MGEFYIAAAGEADNDFFFTVEFQTTWDSLSAADRARLSPAQVREALHATHEQLLSRPGNRIYIARDAEGRRAGLLWLGVHRNLVSGQDEFWVYNITVQPEFRRQGLARHLLGLAEDLARQEGYDALGLMVAEHNAAARALYERVGFRTTNLLMRKSL